MKEYFLTLLRDRKTGTAEFREAGRNLCSLIACEIASQVPLVHRAVETPLGSASGARPADRIILVPILRSGLALLSPFLTLFPEAAVGFLGIRRDEETALPSLYYENIPPLGATDRIHLLDPMLGTAGSATLALEKLRDRGAEMGRITLVAIIGSKEGVAVLRKKFPEVKLSIVAIDEALDGKKYIVPGLGDFGDRFFGTELNERGRTG